MKHIKTQRPATDKNRFGIWKLGPPLPKVILGKSKQDFSKVIKADPVSFWLQVIGAWVVIFFAIGMTQAIHPALVLVAIPLIASRQNILGLLMHEQAHYLCFSPKTRVGKWGDLMVNLFCAYPLLVDVGNYAQVHLQHHAKYFTNQDPDYLRKQGKQWSTPITKKTLLLWFLKDLCGMSLIAMIVGKKPRNSRQKPFPRAQSFPKWIKPAYYALFALILTITQSWHLYLLFWFLPLATVFQMFVRWGALCEHRYNLIDPAVNESTPIIILRWWERILYDNLNFGMHIYHHYHPGIPYHYLRFVHEQYRKEGLVVDRHVFHGYWPYLKHILSK